MKGMDTGGRSADLNLSFILKYDPAHAGAMMLPYPLLLKYRPRFHAFHQHRTANAQHGGSIERSINILLSLL
jgi:hypothetical protein